jgi:hypothetical protein
MSGNENSATGILGSLHSVDGRGVVRVENRYDANIQDVWSAR